jgi:hypothetical protein
LPIASTRCAGLPGGRPIEWWIYTFSRCPMSSNWRCARVSSAKNQDKSKTVFPLRRGARDRTRYLFKNGNHNKGKRQTDIENTFRYDNLYQHISSHAGELFFYFPTRDQLPLNPPNKQKQQPRKNQAKDTRLQLVTNIYR